MLQRHELVCRSESRFCRRNFIGKADAAISLSDGAHLRQRRFSALRRVACVALADWDGYAARRKASASNGKLRGRAIISYIEDTGVFNDRMELRFDPSGAVSIVAGTFSHGQSHATTYAPMCFRLARHSDGPVPVASRATPIRFHSDAARMLQAARLSEAMRCGSAADTLIDKAKTLAGVPARS